MAADIRVEWEADYQPAGARGSAARRKSAAELAGALPRDSSGRFIRRQRVAGRGLSALAGLQRSVQPAISRAQIAAETAALQALQSPTSDWPVDTGFSLAGFFFIGSGKTASLSNRADYAPRVERRTGAIASTLARAEPAIVAAVDAAIQQEL